MTAAPGEFAQSKSRNIVSTTFSFVWLIARKQMEGYASPRALIAEGNVHVTRGLDEFPVGRNQLETVDGFGDRHVAHLIILVADHRAKVTFVCQLHGFYTETRGENSV